MEKDYEVRAETTAEFSLKVKADNLEEALMKAESTLSKHWEDCLIVDKMDIKSIIRID